MKVNRKILPGWMWCFPHLFCNVIGMFLYLFTDLVPKRHRAKFDAFINWMVELEDDIV